MGYFAGGDVRVFRGYPGGTPGFDAGRADVELRGEFRVDRVRVRVGIAGGAGFLLLAGEERAEAEYAGDAGGAAGQPDDPGVPLDDGGIAAGYGGSAVGGGDEYAGIGGRAADAEADE